MLDAELMEHGGMEIVDGGDIFDGGVAEFVGGAVDHAAADSAACHPDRHGFVMVIAAIALGHGSAAEFACPDDEGIFEHPALFEVGDESHASTIDFFGFQFDPLF